MPSPGLIGRKAPPGQGPIATERLNTQIKLLLWISGLAGVTILLAWGVFSFAWEWIAVGEPSGHLLPVVWPAILLTWGCFGIHRLRRELAVLKVEELAERETTSG